MTLVGQKATTAPLGRNPETEGYPMKMCEIISQLEAPAFVARYTMNTPGGILKAKKAIAKAFRLQLEKGAFSLIELMSNCPTNWGVSAVESLKWMDDHTLKVYPPGVFIDKEEVN
jgi:2-oxoglutarate ferredoxin oxidoreductase subunit beta